MSWAFLVLVGWRSGGWEGIFGAEGVGGEGREVGWDGEGGEGVGRMEIGREGMWWISRVD